MEWITVHDFLIRNYVQKNVIENLLPLLNEIDDDGVKILVFNRCNYVWTQKRKFILCELSKLHPENSKINELRLRLKNELHGKPRRRQAYTSLSPFLNQHDKPTSELVELLFEHSSRFNISVLRDMSDASILLFFEDLIRDLDKIIETLHRQTIGIEFSELECVIPVLRHLFFRCFSIIKKTPLDNAYISEKFKALTNTKLSSNSPTQCNWLLEEVLSNQFPLPLKQALVLVLEFMKKYQAIYHDNDLALTKLYQNVMVLTRYVEPSFTKIIVNTKRARIHKRKKLTWRERRPTRIKTNLPVSMPVKANLKRNEKLDRMQKSIDN